MPCPSIRFLFDSYISLTEYEYEGTPLGCNLGESKVKDPMVNCDTY